VGGLHVLTDMAVGVAAAQTPAPLPSPSDLAALDPSVSITLLVSSVVLALLAYIGPAVRDRIRPPKPAEPPAPQAVPASASPPAHALPGASTAVDQAEVRTSQFIDHLLRQLQAGGEREDELEDRLHAKEAEHEVRLRSRDERISQLEQELRRLEGLLWQRGNR
jgi:hypothetical protein